MRLLVGLLVDYHHGNIMGLLIIISGIISGIINNHGIFNGISHHYINGISH